MSTFFVITQFILGALVVLVVMLQKSSSMGFGSYSGSNESLFGAKGPTSFLSKATMFLGAIFLANTLALGYLYNAKKDSSVLDSIKLTPSAPLAPSAPAAPIKIDPTTPQSVPEAPKTN